MTTSKIPDRFKPLPRVDNSFCFGCGPANASGLQMNFYSDGNSVVSHVVVPEHLCGWRNVVHGGILSTILDEIMGWSAIYLLKKVVLTKSMTVDFFKPTLVNQALFVEGRVVDRPDDRHVLVEAAIHNPDNEISARATGLFRLFALKDPMVRKLLGHELLAELSTLFDQDLQLE